MWCNGPPTLGGGLLPPTPIGLGKGGGGALLDDGIPDERIGENGWGAMGNVEWGYKTLAQTAPLVVGSLQLRYSLRASLLLHAS